MSWSVVALQACWVFESLKPTRTNIAARSTSLKQVPNITLQKEIQCEVLGLLSQDSDDIAVMLACEGLCCGV